MNILKRPMLYAAVACCVAAALSLYVKALSFVIIAISLILVTLFICYKKYQYITVALTIVLFTVGLCFRFVQIGQINKFDNQSIDGKFLVVSEPEAYDTFNTVTLKAIQADLPQNTKYLAFDYKQTNLKMGDIVTANLKVSVIDRYDEYRLSNYSNGVYATASCEEIDKTGESNTFYKVAGNVRSYVKKAISKYFKGDTASLLLALTTGDKSLIGDQFSQNVKTTGISHVIVVSGMHLSIIMAAVFWCLDRLFYNKYIRSLLSVAFVIFIFAVCGFTMSITRAGVMFIIAGLSSVFSRDNDSLSSLLTAVSAVLICAPFAVFNVSFQLSVLSTLAIIWAVPFYYRLIINRFNISSRALKTVISVSLCSVFAIIFTLPITINTFGFVSVVSPITNLLITYPITFALVANITALALYTVPIVKFVAYPLFWVAGLCSRFVVQAVNIIAKIPVTVAVLPKNAFWWSIALIAAVIGYMYYYEYKKKRSDLNANSI